MTTSEFMCLAEDVLMELGEKWNDAKRQRSMVAWMRSHDFYPDSSVCEVADTYLRMKNGGPRYLETETEISVSEKQERLL